MKNILRLVIILGILVISFFISYLDMISVKKPILAQNGRIDLSKWNFSKDGAVSLDGQWELYDHQLLTPEDFTERSYIKPKLTGYIKLTSTKESNKNNKLMEPEGVRTYRLVIKVSPSDKIFGLKLKNIRMSNRLYVNGVMMGSSGNPAEKNNGYYAGMNPYDTYFNIKDNKVEIIIQCANFGYPFRGTMYGIYFGLQKNINFITMIGCSVQLSAVIFMFLISVYILQIYCTLKMNSIYLYYAINFLALVTSLLFNGEEIILQLFPHMPFELFCKIQQISIVLIVISLLGIIKETDKKILSKSIIKTTNILELLYILIVVITTYPVYMYLSLINHIFITVLLVTVILKLIIMIKKDIYKSLNKKEAVIFLETIICIGIFLLNKFLYSLDLVPTRFIGSLALCGFIILSYITHSNGFLKNYKAMEKMSIELIKMDKVKDEFITRTSYELKAPLYGIINIAETIIKENSNYLKDKNIKDIIIIKNIALKLCNVVKDTLDVTLLKNGQLKVNICTVDIKVCTNIVVESYRYIMQKRNIEIVNNIKESILVKADENRIKQVLFNLIDNAVRNMDKGTVKIDCSIIDDIIYVSVEDTGHEIPENKREKIFKPYESLNSEETGLGLYITYQLVQLMDGQIYLEWSEKNKGSRFVFSLPLSKEKNNLYEKRKEERIRYFDDLPPAEYSDTSQVEVHKSTILIVDNEIFNIQTAANIFYREGYNVLTASSGDEALKKVKDNKIDLVLLDVMMPGISGIDVCRKIRQKYSLIELPILISTLKDTNYDLFLGFEAGANDFITKPFEEKQITARVKTLIQLKKSMEDMLKNELAFLQAQIKPHFLYNTISTIISFCYTDGEKAAALLTNFSKYLRFTFDIDNKLMTVPLRSELELVSAYVEIEKARFGNKINVEYDIQQELMREEIPALCIQPLVENAIKYGLLGKKNGGTVYVCAKKKKNIIYIVVEDNGIGMSKEKLKELKNIDGKKNGIGFSNVNKRIKKLKRGHIDICSIEGKGTKVTIYITV